MKLFDKLFKKNKNKQVSEEELNNIYEDISAEILDERFREAFNEITNLTNNDNKNDPENFIPKGKFGYEKTNPIMAKGISQGYRYLSKLECENGDRITYDRIGSFGSGVDELPHPMDGYIIMNEMTGEKICTLYIYAYSHENSINAPEGFHLK